jgi:hypothetical protein
MAMSSLLRHRAIVVSAVIFLAGVICAGLGLQSLRSKLGTISENHILESRLTIFESQLSEIDDAKAALSGMESRVPADLDDSLSEFGLLEKVTESRDSVQSLGDGWSALSREISLGDVVLGDLDRFVRQAQQLRPPWVLVKVEVRSSPFESGRGQVVLTMQALRGKQK